MKRRIVSMVLAAAVVASSVSTAAFAAEIDLTAELVEIVAEEDVSPADAGEVQEELVVAEEAAEVSDEEIILDLDSDTDTQEMFDVIEDEAQTEAETTDEVSSEEASEEDILSKQDIIDAEDLVIEEIAEVDEAEIDVISYAADETVEDEETVYVLMNIPFSVFYQDLNNDTAVDTVSSATAQKSAGCSNVYFGDTATISGGTEILGVTFPVRMDAAAYETLKENEGLTSKSDYYISSLLKSEPSVYKTLTYADSSYQFSDISGDVESYKNIGATITSNTTWGDYQINLTNADFGVAPKKIYGIYLTTTDGSQYALRQGENLWTPGNYYEFAWSTGVKTSEPHGSLLKSGHYADMEGKTISQITYITTNGILNYKLSEGLYVTPHSQAELQTTLTDTKTIKVTGLPSDAQDAKVSVYTGSKKDKTYLAENADLAADGTVALTAAPTYETTYTVVVETSNYAAFTTTLKAAFTYVLMNVPFDEFYQFLDQNKAAVDAVSSATAQKSAGCSNVYFGETPSIEGGTEILGITVPVQVTADIYNELKDLEKKTADYYISGILTEEPKVYLVMTGSKGSYSYTLEGGEPTVKDKVEATITSNTTWGDYQINLADSSLGIAPADVYGIYLTTQEGSQYALRQGENLWNPHSYYEFAWSTGVKTSEPHGSALKSGHYANMEGQTITAITYITTSGITVYNLAEGLLVAQHYDGSIKAELKDTNTVAVTGIPAEAKDVQVSVYTGSKQKTYLAENAAVSEDGTVALDLAPTFGTEYTVVVTSSNYAALTTTVQLEEGYVLMNIPYSVFYEQLNNNADVDVVSSATAQKSAGCSNVYFGAEPAIENGTEILGIVFPVKISASLYSEIRSKVSAATDAYYISSVLTENPSVYMKIKNNSGNYVFSSVIGTKTTKSVSASITSNTSWGDYQINLADSSLGIAPADVYGIYLTTEEGSQYALRQGENLWNPRSYYEFAWSTGVKTSEPHGSALKSGHYTDMEGQTITAITYITTSGITVYNLEKGLYVAPHYNGSITAELKDANTVAVTGIPEDAKDVQVSVYTGSKQKTYLAQNAAVSSDGTVALTAAAVEETTYTVVVESSNYAALTATVKLTEVETEPETETETEIETEAPSKPDESENTTPSNPNESENTTPSNPDNSENTTTPTQPDNSDSTTSPTQPDNSETTTPAATTSIKLNKKSQTMCAGESLELLATLNPATATDQVSWSSSDSSVAKVSSKGKVKALKAGTATITAKLANGETASCKVTVKSSSANSNVTKKTLYLGKSFTWKTTLSRKQSGTTLTFESSDSSVASVNKNGKITAKKAGTATITGRTSSGRSLTCKVTVKEVKATSVKLNVTKKSLSVGKTYTLKTTVSPSNSTDTLTYSSSDSKVAKVSKTGKITAVKAGTATITVKTASGKKATCKVTVTGIKATSVKLNATKKSLSVGKTYTLKATVAPTNSTDSLTYSSSNTKVAKVSKTGKITALKAGTATITVKTESGKKATCKVTVK